MHRVFQVGIFLFISGRAYAGELYVVWSKGEAQIKDHSGELSAVPAGGVHLQEGQSLKLAAGATAKIISNGNDRILQGPRTFSFGDTADNTVGLVKTGVAGVLNRKTWRAVAATRGDGDLALLRPVKDQDHVAVHTVSWRCESCEGASVNLVSFPGMESIWTGKGDSPIAYDGPALEAGSYGLQFSTDPDSYHGFRVAPAERQQDVAKVVSALQSAHEGLSSVEQVGMEAALWFQAGFPDEALRIVERAQAAQPSEAGLTELQAAYWSRLDPSH